MTLLCLILLGSIQVAEATEKSALKKINLNHSSIRYLGSNYVNHNNKQVSFSRHSANVLTLRPNESNFNAGQSSNNNRHHYQLRHG